MHPTTSATLLHLSTYIDLLHFAFLNQSFSCFLQLISSILSLIIPVYIFHPFHVPLPSSNILLKSSQSMTIPPHTICPCQLICCFLQSQHVHQLYYIPLVSHLYTAHCTQHRYFCFSHLQRESFSKQYLTTLSEFLPSQSCSCSHGSCTSSTGI